VSEQAPTTASSPAPAASSAPRALVLDNADNVAVAVVALRAGETVVAGDASVVLREDVRFGHKFALRSIPADETIVKYGEIIGRASADIDAGAWVHVHNVVSARLPGPGGS
jgi:altronate dehydratase